MTFDPNLFVSVLRYIYIYIYIVFFNGRVIPKIQMILDASLLNTQHYEVEIKGKGEKSKEKCGAIP